MPNYQSAHAGAIHDQYATRAALIDLIYPVGSIYISVNSTSPATFFGGTWQAIENTFLVAAGSSYTAGGTGGAASHTHTLNHTHTYAHTHTTPATTTGGTAITVAQMPAHKHNYRHYVSTECGYVPANSRANSIVVRSDVNGISNTGGTFTDRTGTVEYNGNLLYNTGGGQAHTHGQIATTTNSQSTSTTSDASTATTSSTSNLPPYLAVYMWKRTG